MSARFRRAFYKLAPSWLTTGEGELVQYSLNVVFDAFCERARLSLLARFPSEAPPDALGPIGRDRQILRGFAESRERYVTRLLSWLDDHRIRGNAWALFRQLRGYLGDGVAMRTVDNRSNWYSRDAEDVISWVLDAGNWGWDNTSNPDHDDQWSRYWVIIYSDGAPWEPGPDWGDPDLWAGAWGSPGYTWGSTATPDQVRDVRSLVRFWKPAGTHAVAIIIAFDPASFDPLGGPEADGTWGHWSIVDGGGKSPARLATARYWDGSS